MQDIKDIEWNVGAVIAAAFATGFIVLQVYLVSIHLMGLSMIGSF
jgi:hypothetical protein